MMHTCFPRQIRRYTVFLTQSGCDSATGAPSYKSDRRCLQVRQTRAFFSVGVAVRCDRGGGVRRRAFHLLEYQPGEFGTRNLLSVKIHRVQHRRFQPQRLPTSSRRVLSRSRLYLPAQFVLWLTTAEKEECNNAEDSHCNHPSAVFFKNAPRTSCNVAIFIPATTTPIPCRLSL